MSTIRIAFCCLLTATCVSVQSPASDVINRDTWKLQFHGNTYYSADGIRTGLSLDSEVQRAAAGILVSTEEYLEILRNRITRGYLHSGFRDVQISATADAGTGLVTVSVNEGTQFVSGDVSVEGLSVIEAEFIEKRITDQKEGAGTNAAHPLWTVGRKLSFLESPEQTWGRGVKEDLFTLGYPEAQFSLKHQTVESNGKSSVNLQISVTNPGQGLTIGDIIFAGLDQHSPDELIDFLELKQGMPLTLDLREQLVHKLLDSGRFLMAEAKPGPYFFDPSNPVELQIRVREYDPVAPIGQPLTEFQQSIMKLNKWLSNWGNGNDDLRLTLTLPVEEANTYVLSAVPSMLQPACEAAIGTSAPGQFSLTAWISPSDGTLITVQVADAQQNVTMKRTVLLTKAFQGLIAWQARKKWFYEKGDYCFNQNWGFAGLWPTDDSQKHGEFRSEFGVDLNGSPGLHTNVTSTAAALIDYFHESSPRITVADGLQRWEVDHGFLELDSNNGALKQFVQSGEGSSLVIDAGIGLLQSELDQIQKETGDWENQCVPGREWIGLATMLVEDLNSIDPDHADALHLCLDLLNNRAAVARLNSGLDLLKDRTTLVIPSEEPVLGSSNSKMHWYLAILAKAAPAGSVPHRFVILLCESLGSGDTSLFGELCKDIIQDQNHGSVLCLMMARPVSGGPVGVLYAKTGLERLSTAEFENDMASFVTEPCLLREIVCSLIVWVQQTSDDNVEKIVKSLESVLKDQNGQLIDVRPVLALIRNQRDRAPEEIFAELLPVIWEGGLRAIVEAELTAIATAPPRNSRTSIGLRAIKIFDPLKTDSSKPPVKPASDKKLFNEIQLN